MNDVLFTALDNALLARDVYRLRLQGDTGAIARPGQFVNLKVEGCFLRRPISVCDLEEDVLTLIYKVVGKGTATLSRLVKGETIRALTGLGNGYDCAPAGERPLLVGGGVGVPPLFLLAKELRAADKAVCVCLGFGAKEDAFYLREFRELGCEVRLATLDGSLGHKGFVTEILPERYDHFFACGPEPMLRAVCAVTRTSGQLSFEARMGCGFGACMGCSCQTLTGSKRICREGPVLRKEELLWTR